jgi:hypothetical protein
MIRACLDRLTAAGFEFQVVVLAPASNPACEVDTLVRVKAIKSASRTRIRLAEEPVVACRFVEPLAHWLGEVVAGCGWFTTVLGPGSDEAHANHIHVDILQHGSSNHYRIFQ